jgi:hypothetical protein
MERGRSSIAPDQLQAFNHGKMGGGLLKNLGNLDYFLAIGDPLVLPVMKISL